MAGKGGLDKLTITGFADPGFNSPAKTRPNPIKVMINPNQYSQAMGVCYTKQQGAGGTGKKVVFNRDKGEALELALVFDGTGSVPDAPSKSVDDQLADLKRLIYEINGAIHSPNYVQLAWGSLLFKGRLKTMGIDYTLFAPDGTALRAKVKAVFLGYHDNTDGRAAQKLSSPDMTHVVTVLAGDTLPLLCHRIYGDSRYYLAVADHNGLDDFRTLEPGRALLFPPIAQAGR
jgi:nucleoid-associated protein YgaU